MRIADPGCLAKLERCRTEDLARCLTVFVDANVPEFLRMQDEIPGGMRFKSAADYFASRTYLETLTEVDRDDVFLMYAAIAHILGAREAVDCVPTLLKVLRLPQVILLGSPTRWATAIAGKKPMNSHLGRSSWRRPGP